MSEKYTGLEIAIIGMAGRFPMASTISDFWENLCAEKECIRFLDGAEQKRVPKSIRDNPNYVPCQGGVLENKDIFDAEFFHYTPLEAELMDPQIRLFHECAWEALEDAGIYPKDYKGLIGLYAAASSGLFWQAKAMMSQEKTKLGYFAASSLFDKDLLSTRISYKLNLRGPSMMVHTTCSGSLVAVHLACQAILNGECDVALAGGAKINVQDNHGYVYEKGMILSPDGHCRAFDQKANGTVGGEGVGVVVLKALEDAIRDKDNIHAIIKASAVSNDGDNKLGYTAPSVEGQAQTLRMALRSAGVAPTSITYIETHGTGTEIGDPIEVEALKQAYASRYKNYCAIGSVKTNIGHLDSAAGVAGLIKTVMALKNKKIPASLNFTSPNEKMDIENSPFFVNTKLREWNGKGSALRAAVSSFGIGGTNAHIILEEAPLVTANTNAQEESDNILLLSAQTPEGLEKSISRYHHFLNTEQTQPLSDICFTTQTARHHFAVRAAVVCKNKREASEMLEQLLQLQRSPISSYAETPIVFMFSGQGSQYVNMASGLYAQYPLFRCYFDQGIQCLEKWTGNDLKAIWKGLGTDATQHINDTAFAQPLLYLIEYGIAQVLINLGVKPRSMIGHSIGEYTAAAIAGVFSFEDGLKIVSLRGKLMQQMPEGSMISVPLPESEAKTFLYDSLSLAAVNTASSCVLSGSHEAIEQCIDALRKCDIEPIRLHTSHAFHSSMMEPMLRDFEKAIEQIVLHKPTMPFISNVTGKLIRDDEATSSRYWSRHIRATVRFSEGINSLAQQANTMFIEVGPGKILSGFVKSLVAGKGSGRVVSTVRHPKDSVDDGYFLGKTLADLWIQGVAIDWKNLHSAAERKKVSLPAYAFNGKKYWLSDQLFKQNVAADSEKDSKEDIENWFYVPSWKQARRHREPLSLETDAPDFWLIFEDSTGLAASLVHEIRRYYTNIVIVRPGRRFEKVSETTFNIQPGNPEDYRTLIQNVWKTGHTPGNMIDCWGISQSDASNATDLVDGFNHHRCLVQAILSNKITDPLNIILITNQVYSVVGDEQINPANSGVTGLLKVAPQEMASLQYRHIDIDFRNTHQRVCSNTLKGLVSDVLQSVTHPATIAYRNGIRWQLEYEPFPLSTPSLPAFKTGGVYVITGGLGVLGLYLAEYLVRSYQANVILTHHADFPPFNEWDSASVAASQMMDKKMLYRIAALKRMENYPGKVTVKTNIDVANVFHIEKLFNEVASSFDINGVFHFAGITDNRIIFRPVEGVQKEDLEKISAPKVAGLRVLAEALKHKKLDFCLVSSSLSAVLGGLGFSTYSAANALLDATVHSLQRKSKFPLISVNFDSWKIDPIDGQQSSMVNEEGLLVLERIVGLGVQGQVITSIKNLERRISNWIKRSSDHKTEAADKQPQSAHPRPHLSVAFTAPSTENEKALEEILKQAFGYDRIGVADDFFELGGDSLLAINVIANIHKKFNTRILISDFYAGATIEGLIKCINRSTRSEHKGIKAVEAKQYYDLSAIQKRLYVANQLSTSETHYNTPFVFLLEGKVQHKEIESVVNQLIKRHDSLRTSFRLVRGVPKQIVQNSTPFALEPISLTPEDLAQDPEQALRKIASEFIRPFDLAIPPLFRAAFLSLHEDRHVLLMDIHHIITDAVSNKVLIREMQSLLDKKELGVQKVQYKDFCVWHEIYLKKNELSKQAAYWLSLFAGEIPYTLLPTDMPRTAEQQFQARRMRFGFDKVIVNDIRQFITSTDSSTYIFFLTVITVLLSKYVNQRTIVVGTETAGRPHADLESVVGMFVGLLPLKNEITAENTFAELLSDVKRNTLQAFENQDYQFIDLVNKLRLDGLHRKQNPLFSIIVSMDNISMGAAMSAGSSEDRTTIRLMDFQGDKTIWDVRFGILESEDNFHVNVSYRSALFHKATIDRMAERVKEIVLQVLANPSILVNDIQIKPITKKKSQRSVRNETLDFDF